MSLVARKYLQAILGITLIGVGVAFNYTANLGLGPWGVFHDGISKTCLLYTSPSPRDRPLSRMPSSA